MLVGAREDSDREPGAICCTSLAGLHAAAALGFLFASLVETYSVSLIAFLLSLLDGWKHVATHGYVGQEDKAALLVFKRRCVRSSTRSPCQHAVPNGDTREVPRAVTCTCSCTRFSAYSALDLHVYRCMNPQTDCPYPFLAATRDRCSSGTLKPASSWCRPARPGDGCPTSPPRAPACPSTSRASARWRRATSFTRLAATSVASATRATG